MSITAALDAIAAEGPAARWLRIVSENTCPRCGQPQWRCICADPEEQDVGAFDGEVLS